MNKKKKSGKKKSQKLRVNISLWLSIIAILISLGQLIFDNPFFLKHFNQVEINATELDVSKSIDGDKIKSSFLIENIGKNTAKNVEIRLRVLEKSSVIITPDIFELVNPEEPLTPARNLLYRCDELVPGDKIKLLVFSDFSDYLKINSLDTLYYNKTRARPERDYGPYISGMKHSLGKVMVDYKDSLVLREY